MVQIIGPSGRKREDEGRGRGGTTKRKDPDHVVWFNNIQ